MNICSPPHASCLKSVCSLEQEVSIPASAEHAGLIMWLSEGRVLLNNVALKRHLSFNQRADDERTLRRKAIKH